MTAEIYCSVCKKERIHFVEDGFGECLFCGHVIDEAEVLDKIEIKSMRKEVIINE